MSTLTIVLLVILAILIIACIVLYFLGKKAEKRQAEQKEKLDAAAQTMSILMCDAEVFPLIPVKKEVKATVSGIYITAVKGLRGSLEAPQKKKGLLARLRGK